MRGEADNAEDEAGPQQQSGETAKHAAARRSRAVAHGSRWRRMIQATVEAKINSVQASRRSSVCRAQKNRREWNSAGGERMGDWGNTGRALLGDADVRGKASIQPLIEAAALLKWDSRREGANSLRFNKYISLFVLESG